MMTLLRHQAWLRRLAVSIAGEPEADDLVQSAWIAALRRPPREAASIRAWLRRVTWNLWGDLVSDTPSDPGGFLGDLQTAYPSCPAFVNRLFSNPMATYFQFHPPIPVASMAFTAEQRKRMHQFLPLREAVLVANTPPDATAVTPSLVDHAQGVTSFQVRGRGCRSGVPRTAST